MRRNQSVLQLTDDQRGELGKWQRRAPYLRVMYFGLG
jgi:hypothetical protein